MRSNQNSTTVKKVAGYTIKLTPGNEVFIVSPEGVIAFISGVDVNNRATLSVNVGHKVPDSVLKAAGKIQAALDDAAQKAIEDDLCEPPADLYREGEDALLSPTDPMHEVEELIFS